MASNIDSSIPGAFLPYWREALDGDPDEANRLMGQFISDLAKLIVDTTGAKKQDREK